MQCLFSFSYCLAYFLIVQIVSNEVQAVPPVPAPLCDIQTCVNLGNISAPFWSNPECAASDTFVFSNCSLGQASWEAFKEAVHYDVNHPDLGAPALVGLYRPAGSDAAYINLTWALDEMMQRNACGDPFSLPDVEKLLPDVINLTSFADGSFQFSPFNSYLLFNCSNVDNILPNVTVESSICQAYKHQCQRDLPCAQLKPGKELALLETLETMSCSRFLFLATHSILIPIPQWSTATIQLIYGDSQLIYNDFKCQVCVVSGGECSINKDTQNFEQCLCRGAKYSVTDCNGIDDCNGVFCKIGAKIGIGVASAVLAIVAFMLLLWVYKKKRPYSTKSIAIQSSNHLLTQRAYMLSKKFGPVATREFTFESLAKATKSFADQNIIGDGGFGAVYLGILKDGRKVAVKRLYHDNFKRMDHFYNEIKILSSIDHPHLVKLYGFCCQDSNDLLLVFEYAANGTISDQLHDPEKPAMPWKTRLNIARETSEALYYLHNSVKPPIYHRDVKTTNILLDADLHVKLADFGLSRLVPLEASHVSTAPQGTPGYLDPDYHQCYQLTDKSDVYSFGVVLVELVSAKLAVDMSRERREINLSSLALMKIGCGMWEDLVDPRLEMKKNPKVEMTVKCVVELAFMCLHAEKDSRPTMEYVLQTLSKLCQEFGHGAEKADSFSFEVVDTSPTSSMDETKHLMRAKSASKSKCSANMTPPSTDYSSSNTSSSSAANSF